MDIVCNCRGTTGGICHTCLEREIIVFDKWQCMICEQNYKNIEIICNNRWLDLITNILSGLVVLYFLFVTLPTALIELVLSIITRGKVTIDLVFIVIMGLLGNYDELRIDCWQIFWYELIAIRVVRRRDWLSLLYHIFASIYRLLHY